MIRFFSFLLFLLLTACSTISIAPQPQAGSQIDMDGKRIGRAENGAHLSVMLHEAIVRPSPADRNYSSFWVEVTNQRNVMLPLSFTDFLLIDDQGRQFQALDPQQLVEQLTDTVAYLVPYPYVGFYYLEDSVRSHADTQFRSEGDYFASRRPEYLASDALPVGDVLPASSVQGAIYFPAELRTMKSFQLRYLIGALPGQKTYQISLPFLVEDK